MGVCPGCGRCQQCGQPAPIPVQQPWTHPIPIYPTTIPWPASVPRPGQPYYAGDLLPGQLGSITVTY